jgi:hypothetical protein
MYRSVVVAAAAVAFLGIANAAKAANFNSFGGSEILFSGAGAVVGGTGSPLGNAFLVNLLQRQLAAEAQQQAIANALGRAEQRRLSPIINCPATASSTGLSQLFACISRVR